MRLEENPFAPGAGSPPPELAGRDELREKVRIALARVRAQRPTKSLLRVGLPGCRQDSAVGPTPPGCTKAQSALPEN